MMKSKPIKTVFYETLESDVVPSADPDFRLPDDYDYDRDQPAQKALGSLIRFFLKGFGFAWCQGWLHVKVSNPELLDPYRDQGYFLYINHTQPVGDPFLPLCLVKGKPFSTICLPANLKVPFFGPLLPWAGALPLPESLSGMRTFRKQIEKRIKNRECVVIFPEARVWPYCTFLRPFPDTSFQYSIDLNVPVFCGSVTYRPGRWKKPVMEVHLDGPFYPDESLPRRKKRRDLKERTEEAMKSHFREDDAVYIEYQHKEQKSE